MSEENKEIVRRIEEAWNTGNLDSLDQYFAEGFAPPSGIPQAPPGRPGAKISHAMAMQSFPDRRVTIEDLIGEGDKVVARCRVTGTNQGGVPWAGAPANGNPVDFEWISVYQLQDGKVVNHWAINDAMTLMVQLGVIPMPEPAPDATVG
jgi:ketosteroid isomerase-like protein